MKFTPLFLFALIFITSMSLVASAPAPFTSSPTGLQIETPQFQYAKIGTDIRFHAHVINETKILTNATTTCFLHFYNPQGFDVLTVPQLMEFEAYNGIDFATTVRAGNYTTEGVYPFVITCNTSAQAGFLSGYIEVTPNGNAYPEGITIVIFSLIFIAIICFGVIYFLKALAHTIQLEMDLIDTAIMVCTYLALFLFYYISFEYLGNTVINDLLETAISVGAITHVFLPLVAFILSFIMTNIQYKQKAKYTY